jgi:hypothetical protein
MYLLIVAAAVRLRQPDEASWHHAGVYADQANEHFGEHNFTHHAGRDMEIATVRWTRCWNKCSLPRGNQYDDEFTVSGDMPACLAHCVSFDAKGELRGDKWYNHAEHMAKRAREEADDRHHEEFWDFVCDSDVKEGCRSVPEKLASEWVRLEVDANATREEGRQWLLRQQTDFDAAFSAFETRLQADLESAHEDVARDFLEAYKNETGQENEDEALAALLTAAEEPYRNLQALQAKAAASTDSNRKLLRDREIADAKLAKDELELKTLPEDERPAKHAEIKEAWKAAHEAAEAAHVERVKKAQGRWEEEE